MTYYTPKKHTKPQDRSFIFFRMAKKHCTRYASNTDRISVSFNYGPDVRNWIGINKDDGDVK